VCKDSEIKHYEARIDLLEAENQQRELEIERIQQDELLRRKKHGYAKVYNRLTLVTLLILAFHNYLIQDQNKLIRDNSERVWRAQLIATIYDEDCSQKNLVKNSEECNQEVFARTYRGTAQGECPPKAHYRSRHEAALALIRLDRSSRKTVSLAGAKLDGVDLGREQLKEADLRSASLRGAILGGADLYHARLINADLEDAFLRGADLRWARLDHSDLKGADLNGADLRWANLSSADLRGADLKGAIVRGAVFYASNLSVLHFTKEQLYKVITDGATILPPPLADEKSKQELRSHSEELQKERMLRYEELFRDQHDSFGDSP
jgi:hypothetical protein